MPRHPRGQQGARGALRGSWWPLRCYLHRDEAATWALPQSHMLTVPDPLPDLARFPESKIVDRGLMNRVTMGVDIRNHLPWTVTIMATLYYLRCSTDTQTIESQRSALGIPANADPVTVYMDEGVSGAIDALDRPQFARCAAYARAGDVLRVTALDRLGRNAIDVQQTFKLLIDKGVIVDVLGMGVVAGDIGKLLVTILSGVAQMERAQIARRTEAGRVRARELLAGTGKTQNGKASLGRPHVTDPAGIKAWRDVNRASKKTTAEHFGVSQSTVQRACATA